MREIPLAMQEARGTQSDRQCTETAADSGLRMPLRETSVRVGVFPAVFNAMVLWETAAPRRASAYSRLPRWPSNLAVLVLNIGLVRNLLSTSGREPGSVRCGTGSGFLNSLPLPSWGRFLASVILFDLAIYVQHITFHALPALWRVHRMHPDSTST